MVLDESGFSKGYGFVRFGNEQEQQHALGCMTGEMGLGSKPIKVGHRAVVSILPSFQISNDNVEVDCVSDSMPLVRRCPWLTRRTELRMAGAYLPRPAG